MLSASVVLLAAFQSTAKAVPVNPANWTFDFQTYRLPDSLDGQDAYWDSLTNVDTDYPQYDYNWQLTQAELLVAGEWQPILDDYIDPRSGSGTAVSLPFDILDQRFEERRVFAVNIHVYVDEGGFGHISATNVYFDNYLGSDVEGFRCQGTAAVTAVPEPAALSLLALGSLALLKKRKGHK